MKRLSLLAILICLCWHVNAVNYCATQSWGYAGTSVTGGGNATPTLVTNESQLSTALNSNNKVIIITQNITVTNHISSEKSNLTILALPGVKLISNKQNQNESGIFYLKGSNLILRNLTFEGPGAYDCDGWDNLCLDGAKNVWVDHCDFQDGCDGNFDIKGTADNITVSWCRFRYLKEPKAGGSGGSDDHRYSNLVGSGENDKPTDGTYNITYAYCWWDEGCRERMTRCRNASLHFLNCYWNSSVANYYIGPQNADCYIEGCTFEGKPAQDHIFYQNYGGTNGAKFVNCSATKGVPADITNRTVVIPTYSYTALPAAEGKSYVTNTTCGAGATLTVTNAAAVSSSCDGDDPDPQPVVSDFWNISDDDFKNLGNISSETTIRGLHIVATESKAVTVEANEQTLGDENFTYRLKLNGSGSSDARHLWFDVTGSCKIEVYLMSAKNSEVRTLNIATGSFSNVQSTLSAEATLAKKSYSYTGGAGKIYLYSANSGINLYGIRLINIATTIENIENKSVARKVLRNGQVLILRDGKTYNLLGSRID